MFPHEVYGVLTMNSTKFETINMMEVLITKEIQRLANDAAWQMRHQSAKFTVCTRMS